MREIAMNRQSIGRRRLTLLCSVVWCGTIQAAAAQTTACGPPNRAAAPASREDPASVCRLLSALAADSMEGRATGSRGAHRAARFIAEQFRAAGLEPAGDSGFFQRVPLIRSERPN